MISRIGSKKLLIALGIANAAAIGAYGFALWKLQDVQIDIANLSAEARTYSATDATVSSLRTAFGRVKEQSAAIDSHYIPAEGVVDFIALVESLARQSGLDVRVLSVDAEEVDKSTKKLQERLKLRLDTRGSWTDLQQFAGLLETMEYKASIEEASFEKLDAAPAQGSKEPAKLWHGVFAITALKLK